MVTPSFVRSSVVTFSFVAARLYGWELLVQFARTRPNDELEWIVEVHRRNSQWP